MGTRRKNRGRALHSTDKRGIAGKDTGAFQTRLYIVVNGWQSLQDDENYLGMDEVSHEMSWKRLLRHMAISEAMFIPKEWGKSDFRHGKTSEIHG